MSVGRGGKEVGVEDSVDLLGCGGVVVVFCGVFYVLTFVFLEISPPSIRPFSLVC